MWCFDVEARIERNSIVSSHALKHATLRGPGSSEVGDGGGSTVRCVNEKLTSAEWRGADGRDFAFAFGEGGKSGGHRVTVREVKAIFGKFIKDGKLTIESRDGVKVLLKGSPVECGRLMKTLTTLKSLPAASREAYLSSLTRCAKCVGKCQANELKMEERQQKAAVAAAAAAAASAEKKRKRDAVDAERRAEKDSKLDEQLRNLEEKKFKIESARSEITSLKIDIEGEREALLKEKESIVQSRRELEDEKRLLQHQLGEAAKERARIESERKFAEIESRRLAEEEAQNAERAKEIETERVRLNEAKRKLEEEREKFESERSSFENDAFEARRAQSSRQTDAEEQARRVREEIFRRAQARAEDRANQTKRSTQNLKAASPSSFYGTAKKKAKIVMDDDDDDDDENDDGDDDESNKENKENENRRKQELLERMRKAELERQLKEKLAREACERRTQEAQRRKEAARRASEERAQQARRQKQEDEARDHHRYKAQQHARMRENSRTTSIPTANKAMWESHLAALEHLKSRPKGSLRESDFPWPPPHNIAFFTKSDTKVDKKKKVMKATLSWHPDKFEQKFGQLLREDEAKKIRDRVRALSSQYIELRHVLNGQ